MCVNNIIISCVQSTLSDLYVDSPVCLPSVTVIWRGRKGFFPGAQLINKHVKASGLQYKGGREQAQITLSTHISPVDRSCPSATAQTGAQICGQIGLIQFLLA